MKKLIQNYKRLRLYKFKREGFNQSSAQCIYRESLNLYKDLQARVDENYQFYSIIALTCCLDD